MENKVIWFAKPKNPISTKHVFLEKDQVFLNKDEGENWYPINFQWIPVVNLAESLK